MKLQQRPYHLLILASILLFAIGLLYGNTTMDIHLHDTYYVFPITYFIWTLSVILLLFWLLYIVTNRMLYSTTLTWAHTLFTIAGCVYCMALPYLLISAADGLAGMPRYYYDIGQSGTRCFSGGGILPLRILGVLLLAGQLTYIVNLLVGVYRKVTRPNHPQ